MRTKSINSEPGSPTRVDIYKRAQIAELTIALMAHRPKKEKIPPSVTKTARIIRKHASMPYVGINLECIEQSIVHLTPQIVLVISEELYKQGIVRLPGDIFYPDWYYAKIPSSRESDKMFSHIGGCELLPSEHIDNSPYTLICRGKLCSNSTYELSTKCGAFSFDLNNESDLTRLIETILYTWKPLCTDQEHQSPPTSEKTDSCI